MIKKAQLKGSHHNQHCHSCYFHCSSSYMYIVKTIIFSYARFFFIHLLANWRQFGHRFTHYNINCHRRHQHSHRSTPHLTHLRPQFDVCTQKEYDGFAKPFRESALYGQPHTMLTKMTLSNWRCSPTLSTSYHEEVPSVTVLILQKKGCELFSANSKKLKTKKN